MKKPAKNRPAAGAGTDDATAARVSWYHYKEGLTQQQVADRVGLSRATVNKIISDARAKGMVRITIDSPLSPCLELENRLTETFGLEEAIVVPAPGREDDTYFVVGQATGDYVSRTLGTGEVLGMTWGSTLHFAAQTLEPRTGAKNTVVSLSGGLSKSTVINPYDNASMFARILDAECYYMTAPMMVESRNVKDAMLASSSIAAVLDIAGKIDLALLTTVDLSPGSKSMEYGVLTEELRTSLLNAGSVGNVCDHYIDANGVLVDHPVNDLTVSVPLDLVRRIPRRIIAGGGAYKADILRACLKAGICTVLITEEGAANALLEPDAQ